MIKKAITANTIVAGLIILSVVSYSILNIFPLFCAFMGMALVYGIFANYQIFMQKSDPLKDIEKYRRNSIFKQDVEKIIYAYKGIKLREEFISGFENDSIRDIYEKLYEQLTNNLISAEAFCRNYDRYNKSNISYLHGLAEESSEIAEKFNIMVEELIDVDNSIRDVDTTVVDDYVDSLRRLKSNE